MSFNRFWGIVCYVAIMVGCDPTVHRLGGRHIELADLSGRLRQPLQTDNATAVVVVFITNDCPISNSYAPEINRIVDQYSREHVAFFIAHVDQDIGVDQARRHAQEFGFSCPVLIDRRHELVRSVGATVTPEAAVINRKGEVVYRGRIDDRYVDFGKKRLEPSQRDLIDAIEAEIDGRAVAETRTKAVGCPIPEAVP